MVVLCVKKSFEVRDNNEITIMNLNDEKCSSNDQKHFVSEDISSFIWDNQLYSLNLIFHDELGELVMSTRLINYEPRHEGITKI